MFAGRHDRVRRVKGARLACVLAVVIEALASAPAAFGDAPSAASESPGHALPPATDTADPCQDFLNILEHPDTTLTWDPIFRRDFAGARTFTAETVWILANQRPSGQRCRSALETGRAPALPAAMKKRAAAAFPGIWSSDDNFFQVLCSLHPDQQWALSWMTQGLHSAPECLAGLYEYSRSAPLHRVSLPCCGRVSELGTQVRRERQAFSRCPSAPGAQAERRL